MRLFSAVLNLIQRININDNLSRFVFYKIVDADEESGKYTLQCINTSATIHMEISDIIFDLDILHGLHPIQACYIGLEYVGLKYSNMSHKETSSASENMRSTKTLFKTHLVNPNSKYSIYYRDRQGNVFFIDKETGKEFLMDPRDIVLSELFIMNFDAAQAFSLGVLAGIKLNRHAITNKMWCPDKLKYKNHHLNIVK